MASNEPPRFLLFVPPPPSPSSQSALKAAFGDTISQVLKEVATASAECSQAAILEIATACPNLTTAQSTHRSGLYDETQDIIAGVYKLVCVVAAAEHINIEDSEGVDVRVLPVAWSTEASPSSVDRQCYGPVVSISTLAQCGRVWQYAFGVESEAGEAIVRAFVTAKGGGERVNRLQGGPATTAPSDSSAQSQSSTSNITSHSSEQQHYDVAVGGTFDHLHVGHKLLLTMTLFTVDRRTDGSPWSATVGITGDQLLVNKKHASVLESWSDRQRAVETFCDSLLDFSSSRKRTTTRDDPGPNGKSVDHHYPDGLVVKCTEIQDPFGPTITEEQISALIISAETRSGGKAVNDKRKEKVWKELDVFEVNVLDADEEGAVKEGFESKLSSTAIREKLARKQGAST